jgi:hypothetical protein
MNLKHGMKYTPEYMAWNMMKQRCLNPKHKAYPGYGGRGIKICARWVASFECFLADVGERPSSDLSLDRWPDKNGNYEPGNVRWATRLEQTNNRRNNRTVTFRDQEMSLADAVRASGTLVSSDTVRQRIDRGWSIEKSMQVNP